MLLVCPPKTKKGVVRPGHNIAKLSSNKVGLEFEGSFILCVFCWTSGLSFVVFSFQQRERNKDVQQSSKIRNNDVFKRWVML